MLVINRFRVSAEELEGFREQLEDALAALAACRGFADGHHGRNVDDPELCVLVTRWADVGSYRRALSTYDVKLRAVPLLGRAVDEPSAYESMSGELNTAIPRGSG